MNSNSFQIRAKFITKNRFIGEQLFENNISFGQIKKFYEDNLSDGTTVLYNSYFLNSNKLEDSHIISKYFQEEPNSQLLEISISIELQELNELKNKLSLIKFDDENEQTYNQIIKPKLNPFGFIVFFPRTNKIQIEEYPNNISKKYGLNELSINFAYCNSPYFLFLSGGENSDVALDYFWIINNKNYNLFRKRMPFPKSKHSMVYIPNWGVNGKGSGAVFIAGGEDIKTFFYDINKKEFYNWGDMSLKHIKPALLVYRNYLYCFNLLNEENIFFEKTYLGNNKKRIWEKVFPRFKGVDPKDFFDNNFSVSKSIEGNILFIGGNKAYKNVFIFNPLNNTIIKTLGNNSKIDFEDKNFYKLSRILSIAIPSNFESTQELYILNKYNFSLVQKKYKIGEKDSNTTFDFSIEKNTDLYHDYQNGNILLQGKFLPLNQIYGNKYFVRNIGNPIIGRTLQYSQIRHPQPLHRYNYSHNNIIVNQNYKNNRIIIPTKNFQSDNQQFNQNYSYPRFKLCKQCIHNNNYQPYKKTNNNRDIKCSAILNYHKTKKI